MSKSIPPLLPDQAVSQPSPSSNTTPEILDWKTRIAYGAGGMTDRVGNQGLKDLGNPLYNLVLGINPATIGIVFVITRLFDAILDPLGGSLSDNSRSRWGRRRPFMFAGAILAAFAVVPIFWMPRSLSSTGQVVWMLATTIPFFAVFTLFSVPYRALAYELAPNYHEKTRLLAVRMVFMMLMALLVPWVYPLVQSGWLGSPRDALSWVACGLGVIVLVSGLIPVFFTREPATVTAAVKNQRRIPLRESLAQTLRCRDFLFLVGMGIATIVGVNVGIGFGSYVGIFYVYGGDARAAAPLLGWVGTMFVLASLASIPLLTALSRRFGKRNALVISLLWGFCSAGSWWFYTPSLPWLQLLAPVFLGPATTALWLLGESMVADVCDAEARRTGERCEAIFSAVFGWILKTGTAFSILGFNLLLNGVGFDVALGTGQGDGTVLSMRVIYAVLPASGFAASILFLHGYRLDSEYRTTAAR
ncbi:MFS transporter [Geminisphaera colitermitum]|uniref:MFS transporter n=1 Tax=Geminisphaera colitermitum TaxID=1148786 RepID=UPI0005BDEC64|nr:MFS transporter [Geminisphaera colitermitum]